MKKIVFAIIALMAAPVVASEPADLAGLGLVGLQTVSDEAGMEVRGLSGSTYALSVGSMSTLLYDTATGNQVNLDVASLNFGDSDAAVGNVASSGGEITGGTAGLNLEVDGFSAVFGQSAFFAGGQTASLGNFAINGINVPSFNGN